jgi:hypothetical protein
LICQLSSGKREKAARIEIAEISGFGGKCFQ